MKLYDPIQYIKQFIIRNLILNKNKSRKNKLLKY